MIEASLLLQLTTSDDARSRHHHWHRRLMMDMTLSRHAMWRNELALLSALLRRRCSFALLLLFGRGTLNKASRHNIINSILHCRPE